MDGESKTVRLYIGQEGEFSNIMINRINDGDWQLQLVFIGLNPSTKYTVEMRIAATIDGFSSTIYKTEVSTVA